MKFPSALISGDRSTSSMVLDSSYQMADRFGKDC